jgi:hypothetical protein
VFGGIFIHILSWLVLAALSAHLIKRAHAVCPRTARVIVVGALLRLAIGGVLFLVSAYQLPLFQSLHDEPGFWVVAPDAKRYYELAVRVAERGVGAIPWNDGSPVYIVLLSAWMHLVGFTPAAGFLLSLTAYIVFMVLLVWRLKSDRLSLLPVAILSFSPALLVHGSQTLKDEVFVTLIGISLIALSVVLPRLVHAARNFPWPEFAVACVFLVAAVTMMAGIRPYYAFEICAIIASAFLLQFLVQPGPSRIRHLVSAGSLCAALYAGFYVGGGKYFYPEFQPRALVARGFTGLPTHVWARLADKRADFVSSGGGTSLVQVPSRPPAGAVSPLSLPESGARASVDRAGIAGILTGMTALFVPMTLLQAIGLFDLSGGRGLLFITDLDTIYMDVTILLTLFLAFRSRLQVEGWLLAYTMIALAVLTMILMGYVVTNFGTLFRLRTLVATPLWLLPLAAAATGLARRPRHPDATVAS